MILWQRIVKRQNSRLYNMRRLCIFTTGFIISLLLAAGVSANGFNPEDPGTWTPDNLQTASPDQLDQIDWSQLDSQHQEMLFENQFNHFRGRADSYFSQRSGIAITGLGNSAGITYSGNTLTNGDSFLDLNDIPSNAVGVDALPGGGFVFKYDNGASIEILDGSISADNTLPDGSQIELGAGQTAVVSSGEIHLSAGAVFRDAAGNEVIAESDIVISGDDISGYTVRGKARATILLPNGEQANVQIYGSLSFDSSGYLSGEGANVKITRRGDSRTLRMFYGKFTMIGRTVLLEEYPGGDSVYMEPFLTPNTVIKPSGFNVVIVPEGTPVPGEFADYNNIVVLGDFGEDGMGNLVTQGAVDVERRCRDENRRPRAYTCLSVQSKSEDSSFQLFDGTTLANGQLEFETPQLEYEGLTDSSEITSLVNDEGTLAIRVTGDEEGEVARLSTKGHLGDLTQEEGFVGDEISIPMTIVNEGGEIRINTNQAELADMANRLVDPTQFLLVERDTIIQLGDDCDQPNSCNTMGIGTDFGMAYQPTDGNTLFVIDPVSVQDYLGEKKESFMMANALFAARGQYTAQGWMTGDRINADVPAEDGQTRTVKGKIIYIDPETGFIGIDTDGDGRVDENIQGDFSFRGSPPSQQQRMEVFERKPQEAIQGLSDYERQNRGEEEGLQAALLTVYVSKGFGTDMDYREWYDNVESHYSSFGEDVIVHANVQVAEAMLQQNNFYGAAEYYNNIVEKYPDSEAANMASQNIEIIETEGPLAMSRMLLVMEYQQEMGRDDRPRSIQAGMEFYESLYGNSWYENAFAGLSSLSPLNIARDFYRPYAIDDNEHHFEVGSQSLDIMNRLIEDGHASNLEEAAAILEFGVRLGSPEDVAPPYTGGYDGSPRVLGSDTYTPPPPTEQPRVIPDFDVILILELQEKGYFDGLTEEHVRFVQTDPSIQAGIATADIPYGPERDEALLEVAEQYRADNNFLGAAMIAQQVEEISDDPATRQRANELYVDILDPYDEWFNFADESLTASSLYDISAEVVNPAAWVTFGALGKLGQSGLMRIPGGARVLSVTGNLMELAPSVVSGSSSSALRGFAGSVIRMGTEEFVEYGAGVVGGPAAENFVMILTGGPDGFDAAQASVRNAFGNTDLIVDPHVHLACSSPCSLDPSPVYRYDGEIDVNALRDLGEVEVSDTGVIRLKTDHGEMYFLEQSMDPSALGDEFVNSYEIRRLAAAEQAFEEATEVAAAQTDFDLPRYEIDRRPAGEARETRPSAYNVEDIPNLQDAGFEEYLAFFARNAPEETTTFIDSHQGPLDDAIRNLKDLFPDAEVTGRLKGAGNLEEKIYRDFVAGEFPPGTTLDEARRMVIDAAPTEDIAMRDVAGTRITVDSIEAEQEVAIMIEETYGDNIIRRKDFLGADNRGDGYYSVHYVVIQDGMPVEIQVRTPAQTEFADWTHDYIYKGEFKTDPSAQSYAADVGEALHRQELGECSPCPMPECPPHLVAAGVCFGG
ncbi:hypothetical protein GF345_04860 [Candidatus Woesearchaeota archaeon]|nr:hypothetical protein [Candidatus Woesearchaeota archaeon]